MVVIHRDQTHLLPIMAMMGLIMIMTLSFPEILLRTFVLVIYALYLNVVIF